MGYFAFGRKGRIIVVLVCLFVFVFYSRDWGGGSKWRKPSGKAPGDSNIEENLGLTASEDSNKNQTLDCSVFGSTDHILMAVHVTGWLYPCTLLIGSQLWVTLFFLTHPPSHSLLWPAPSAEDTSLSPNPLSNRKLEVTVFWSQKHTANERAGSCEREAEKKKIKRLYNINEKSMRQLNSVGIMLPDINFTYFYDRRFGRLEKKKIIITQR